MAINQIHVTIKTQNELFPPDEFFDILDWCWATCSGKFVYNHVHEATEGSVWHDESCWTFEFDNPQDESMFILRWL